MTSLYKSPLLNGPTHLVLINNHKWERMSVETAHKLQHQGRHGLTICDRQKELEAYIHDAYIIIRCVLYIHQVCSLASMLALPFVSFVLPVVVKQQALNEYQA